MELTGRADGPTLGPPTGLVEVVTEWGEALGVDGLALLSERAAFAGLHRQGQRSCGGSCRLLKAQDGWIAVSLPRDEDRDLVPAWLETEWTVDPWPLLEAQVGGRTTVELLEGAHLLGLPVAALGERVASKPYRVVNVDGPPVRGRDRPVVVDLSSLWAGPLAGALLRDRGAEVIKVESTSRPDGARFGPPGFFDRLNGGKKHVSIDLSHADGQAELRQLLTEADVVIEASRPRALQQMGIDVTDGPQVWVSITGYGRASNRPAFGDDAAVAGGLVVWENDEPLFCADAIADPLSGLAAAVAVTDAIAKGRRCLVDLAMADVANATSSGRRRP